MKQLKRYLCLVLVFALILSMTAAFADEPEAKELTMLTYNVAGLPSLDGIIGQQGVNVPEHQKFIGKELNAAGYDVIAVQEDFGYHCYLSGGLKDYRYKTAHSGSIPGGDGMNVFSKYPIYNVKRTTWDKAYGVINDGADELTPKGILYTLIDLGDGIYVDFYDIHADAFGDDGSREARDDNFRQLADMILSRSTDRAVIVTGDFNTSSHLSDGGALNEQLIYRAGLRDAWTELYNNGNYEDHSSYIEKYGWSQAGYWGVWDSVEKFLYKDGGGVHVELNDFSYVNFVLNDKSASDHRAAYASFSFTKTDDTSSAPGRFCVPFANPFGVAFNSFLTTIFDLQKIFAHFDDLLALLG